MVTQAVRVYTKAPVKLWGLALKRGVLPLDLAKYLAWGVASNDVDVVRELSVFALANEKYSADVGAKEAEGVAVGIVATVKLLLSIANAEYGRGDVCTLCVEGVLHHLALMYLYAVARVYNLKPVVEEGEYRGFKYIVVAASEAGLSEIVKVTENMIEQACRGAKACR